MKALVFIFKALIAILLVALIWPLDKAFVKPEYSRSVHFKDGRLVKAFLTSTDKWRIKGDLASWPSLNLDGIQCLEDQRFYYHPGVDPISIMRAIGQNLSQERVVSGASTITMQTVRLIYPRPRNLLSKVIESWQALRLEIYLTKKQIIELYVNHLPFAGNIEGLESASHIYFKKPARLLTQGELAFLYTLHQRPKRWNENGRQNLRKVRKRVLSRWQECGLIDERQVVDADKESIPNWQRRMPSHSEHFAHWMVQREKSAVVHSTLDFSQQRAVEEEVKKVYPKMINNNIFNIAVLVVENQTSEVKSLVGNFDYYRQGQGQTYASFLQYRSPGSLLKPFLFAKLIESGQILPQTLILDTPFELDEYKPENYTGEFKGLVKADWALANSLNVPWVRQLYDIGFDSFYRFMEEGGVKSNLSKEQLGLSAIIGAMHTRMMDIVPLYVALAQEGRLRPLKFTDRQKIEQRQWMHPAVAYLTNKALSLRGRPDFDLPRKYFGKKNIRWKTGTSQGRRDAWAIGYDSQYTVAVWLGNLNYEPSPMLVGSQSAAPLMFEIFERIEDKEKGSIPFLEPRQYFAETEVCAFSGLPPSPACPHRKVVKTIEGLVLRGTCPYHKHILVDKNSGLRLTRSCAGKNILPVVHSVLDLDSDLVHWSQQNVRGLEFMPKFHGQCSERPVSRQKLAILSPAQTRYVMHSGFENEKMEIPINLKTAAASHDVNCFLNGRSVATNRTSDIMGSSAIPSSLSLDKGSYNLFCSDSQGRSDKVSFYIE